MEAVAALTVATRERSAALPATASAAASVSGGGVVKYFNDAIVGGDCIHVLTAIGDIVDGRDSDGGTHSRRSAIQASIAGTSVVRNTNRD